MIFRNKMPSIGNFAANVQITAARPIYNTNYETVLFNFADRDWEFEFLSEDMKRQKKQDDG